MERRIVRFGLVGAGFIGRIHGLALQAVNRVFSDAGPQAEATILIDTDADLAEQQARHLGFERWGTDWRAALDQIDALIIAVPSFMHQEIALGALAQGKHILCEKPVGRSVAEAEIIADAARSSGVTNGVGFTYYRAPLVQQAFELVRSGRIGTPVSFRGWHCEDYLADGEAPFSWRLDGELAGRCGALGDLGWHILSIARGLCGPVRSLNGLTNIVYPKRATADGREPARTVDNEDWASMLVRFEGGATGTVEASRIAHGRKMDIGFELVGTQGSLIFRGERANELELYLPDGTPAENGFRRILASPDHPIYGAFLPAPGHGLGFNDLKTIEIHEFLLAIEEGRNLDPDLDEACRVARICEAVLASSSTGEQIFEAEERGQEAVSA
ncbi:MAG: Gfo/Idh/MocA family protein [Alphaproteobacteria bacterium]